MFIIPSLFALGKVITRLDVCASDLLSIFERRSDSHRFPKAYSDANECHRRCSTSLRSLHLLCGLIPGMPAFLVV